MFKKNNEIIKLYKHEIKFGHLYKNINFLSINSLLTKFIIFDHYKDKENSDLLRSWEAISLNPNLTIDSINYCLEKLIFEYLSKNKFDHDPIIFKRKKKFYMTQLEYDLKEYLNTKQTKYFKNIYDC